MNDETDTQLRIDVGIMKDQLRSIIDDQKEARHSRKNAYLAQEKRDELLFKIDHRLEKVETFMTGASPTLAQFNELQLKAQGAGAAGKWLWALAMGSIGFVAAIVATWQKWLGN